MGYDLNRFKGDVDEELICSICSGVLEDPVQVCFFLTVDLTSSLTDLSLFSSHDEHRLQNVSMHFVQLASKNG